MCDFLDYEQHLSENLQRLYLEDARYAPLREVVYEACRDKDDGLIFAVRKNEIHIYYRGGRLLKITETANGALKVYTDPKYAGDTFAPHNEIAKFNAEDTVKSASVWRENIEMLKGYVARYYAAHGNRERYLQHKLGLCNRDFGGEAIVIDNEYGVRMHAAKLTHADKSDPETFGKFTETEREILSARGLTEKDVRAMTDAELARLRLEYKLCKVDLVTLFKGDDGKYKICLTELKKGNGATGGKAGIKDHIRDFAVFSGKRKNDIVRSVENLLRYKTDKRIGAIENYPEGGIDLDRDRLYISVLCYDLSSERKIKNVEKEITQALAEDNENILPYFHCNLHMKETDGYTLRKADLLAN